MRQLAEITVGGCKRGMNQLGNQLHEGRGAYVWAREFSLTATALQQRP
jgi:hypothetical protein